MEKRSTFPLLTVARARVVLVALTALLSMLALSCSFSTMQLRKLSSPRKPPGIDLGFDHWRQKSVHNAYAQGEGLSEQLERHRFRPPHPNLWVTQSGSGSLPSA